MNIYLKQLIISSSSLVSLVFGSSESGGSGSIEVSNPMQVSPNNTILQNLYALSLNDTVPQNSNSTLSYISLLLGLNTSCTAKVSQMLNSTTGNYTFFAPSDQAFRNIQGFPDFGSNFCDNCGEGSKTDSRGGLISRIFPTSSSNCSQGCNDTSISLNATSAQLMPCLPQILQYHLLNSTLAFNSTSFGFLNRSSYNLTVLPTMLNSTCLVNLANSTSGMMNDSENGNNSSMMQNNQVLVFNISSSNNPNPNRNSNSGELNPFNVTILHGINLPANVTIFDVQSSNGILHVIDALLIPPANLTDTVNATYSGSSSESSLSSTVPSFLNQTDLEQYSNMSGITIFLPDLNSSNSTNSTSTTNFNLTNYIFPSLLYNNRTFDMTGNLSDGVFYQQNLTNLNGENVTILFGRNNAMLFNGSRVTDSNVLMKNGVMHLFEASDSILSGGSDSSNGGSSDNNTVAASLGRILRQMI